MHPAGLALILLVAAAVAHSDEDRLWGEESGGLCAAVLAEADTFAPGEPIEVRFAVRNLSDAPVTVWRRGFWPNHRIDVVGPDGEPLAPTRLGAEKRRAFLAERAAEKNAPHTIEPGATDDGYEPYDLRELFEFSHPGEHRVRIVYQESKDAPRVESAELRLTVTD